MKPRDLRIAICRNDKMFRHSTAWVYSWIEFCKLHGVPFEEVNCYRPDFIDELKKFDCLLWHFGNYIIQDMMIARSVLAAAKYMGLAVFPDINTAWHFDDKIAETYILQAAQAPMPKSWMFYLLDDCIDWIETEASFPLVAKLRCGSGSNNVRLLATRTQALRYARQMFRAGFKTYPSLLFKTKSQLRSARNFEVVKARLRRAPEFWRTLSHAKQFPKEKGYVFFQEYIPNAGYDLKIVVIRDKLSFIARNNRKHDFRASGGGDLFYDRSLVTSDVLSSAFSTSDKLNFQCMGYDYVVDKDTGKGKIVEMSYGFSHTALLQAGGYFDRNREWHEEPLNAPEEVISNLLCSAIPEQQVCMQRPDTYIQMQS